MPDNHDNPKPGAPGRDGNDNDHPFDAITRLYIRTHPADNGTEPLPAALAFWVSPDIWIVKPGGAVGGEAVPLEPNHVKVTVTNAGGIPAVDAYVEAFVADPSTVITPATAFAIGGAFVTVNGYSTADVLLPWTPQAADSGHRCIVARVALTIPLDTYLNPTIFDVVGDRHVAQRNIQVLEVPQGQKMTFRFLIRSPGEGRTAVTVKAFETTFDLDSRALTTMGGCAGGLPATEPLAELGARVLSARETLGRPTLADDIRLPLGIAAKSDTVPNAREVGVRLEATKPRYAAVTIAVSPDEEIGRLHAFDVVQLDDATGEVVGGLTFVVRVI